MTQAYEVIDLTYDLAIALPEAMDYEQLWKWRRRD